MKEAGEEGKERDRERERDFYSSDTWLKYRPV
jgi:hypothetical protein